VKDCQVNENQDAYEKLEASVADTGTKAKGKGPILGLSIILHYN
jgi:hypothetical protein